MTEAQTQMPESPKPAEEPPAQTPHPMDEFMDKPIRADMRSIAKNEIQTFTTYDGRTITLNLKMLKTVLGKAFELATEYETATFVHYCVTNRLDPFRGQVYFIKYKADAPPAFVTSWEVMLDRANRHPAFNGFESGIVWDVTDNAGLRAVHRGQPCDFVQDATHRVVGGWARVYRKDQAVPRYVEVPLGEMEGTRYDQGKQVPTRSWAKMQTTMCTKTPSARALRQAFPDTLGTLLADGETLVSEPNELGQTDGGKSRFGFGEEPETAPKNGAAQPLSDLAPPKRINDDEQAAGSDDG